MKKIFKQLNLFVLLGFPLLTSTLASELTFNGGHKTIESYFFPLKPSNLIQFDNNTGALNTSFTIPFKNAAKDLRKNLKLSYSTYSTTNTGFGIGFNLNLPRFYKNLNPVRANYILEYKNKVVEYQVDGEEGYEKDLTFFSKLKVEENEYIISLPTGERLTFSKATGDILKEESSFKKATITYTWQESGHLSSIKLYNNTLVDFKYASSSCKYKTKYYQDIYSLKAFIKGKVIDSSLCAHSIDINGIKISLTYSDGHLIKAAYSDAENLPLFNAKYGNNLQKTDVHYNIYGSPGEETTALKLGQHGVKFIKNKDLLAKFQLSPGSSKITYHTNGSLGFVKELDLNHDGISDLIVEKIDHVAGVRILEGVVRFSGKAPFGDFVYRQSDNSSARVPIFENKDVYIALGRLNDKKDDVVFYIDPNLKLPQSFNTISPACSFNIDHYSNKPVTEKCNNPSLSYWDKHDDEDIGDVDEPSENYRAVLLKKASLLVGDFNGDSLIDILHCSENSKKIAYGKVGGMSKAKEVSFPCTQYSTAADINNDGFTDLVTSSGVYLNLNQNFKKIDLDNFSEVIKSLKDQEKLYEFSLMSEGQLKSNNGDKTNSTLYKYHIESMEDKKLIFDALENTYSYNDKNGENSTLIRLSLDSGTYHFKGEKSEGEYYPSGPRKRIESLTNALGAKTEITYVKKGIFPLIAKVKKYNLSESSEIKLEFYQTNTDKITGNLLGYKFLRMISPSTKNAEGRENIIHFYSDSSIKHIEKRTPIHGKIAESIHCKLNACNELVESFKNLKGKTLPLKEAESFTLNKWNVIFGNELGGEFKADQYIKTNYLQKNAMKMHFGGNHVFKSADKVTTLSEFSKAGPLKVTVENKIGIQSSSFGTNVGETGIYEKTVNTFKQVGEYLLQESILKYGKFGSTKPIAKTLMSYEKSPGTADFTVITELFTNKNLSEKSTLVLDEFGRVAKTISGRGHIINTSYSADERKVTVKTDEQDVIKKYSKIGELISSNAYNKFDDDPHTHVKIEYSAPGLISKVTQNLQTLSIDIKKSDNDIKKSDNLIFLLTFENKGKLQRTIEKEIDHLGNTILEKQTMDGKQSLISKSFYDANGLLLEDYLPKYNSLEEVKHFEYFYDFMGRLVKKMDNVLKSNETWVYDNNKSYFKNGKLISQVELMPANLMSHIRRGDNQNISVEDSFSNGIKALFFNDLNLRYNKNYDGSINNVVSHDLYEIYDEKRSLFETSYDDMSTVKLNKKGSIAKIENFNNSYTYSYDKRDRLKSLSTNTYNSSVVYDESSKIDSVKFNLESAGLSYKEIYSYNNQDQISNFLIKTDNTELSLNYKYDGVKISSIEGLVEKVTYDKSGSIKEIVYTSGLILKHQRDELGQLLAVEINDNSKKVLRENYKRNADNQISSMSSNFNPVRSKVITNYMYSDDLLFLGESKNSPRTVQRDEFFSEHSNEIFTYRTRVLQMGESQINYGLKNKINGIFTQSGANQVEFLASDLHLMDKVLVKYLEINGIVIGAYIIKDNESAFYPIVTDVRGSLRLAYNDKNEIVLMKNYDAWGYLDRKNFISKNEIDKLLIADFAKLKRLRSSSDYLFAEHRIYNSKVGKWVTLDPLLLNSVKTLLDNRFYEIDGISYAAGDPVNFVDPSGQSAEHAFVYYSTAELGNLGHAIKHHAIAAYKYVTTFLTEQSITGGGGRISTPGGIKHISGSFRVGYDSVKGPEAFGEASYSFGAIKGAGQFGYSNGGLRAIGRAGGSYHSFGADYTVGTSEYARGKFDAGNFGFQYNSTGFGRLDVTFGNFYGAKVGGYFNFQLTPAAYQGFNEASSHNDWAYQGVPYRSY